MEILIYQLVHLTEGGQARKVSKRRGDVVFLDELLDEIGVDAARWHLLSRGHEQAMDIDVDLARERTEKNPVYYVQYAHARIAGILRNAEGRPSSPEPVGQVAPAERELVKRLAEFPAVVAEATERRGPHALPTYAIRVADDFHRFYHDHRVLESEEEPFRLALCKRNRVRDRPLARPHGGRSTRADVDSPPWPAGTVAPDRNLALELVRVTESAALSCARWVGRGDKEAADQAAVDAMRAMLDTVAMNGVVVIGEGEKDEAPMLFNGEEVGNGNPPEVDVAVDPLEGTRLTSVGQPNAIAVIAVAERGTMFFPGAAVYMDKIAAGAEVADVIDITATPQENITRAAEAKGVKPTDITVVVLDRDRNADLISGLRDAGAKVNLITDGDVAPAIAAARQGSVVDLMMGIGGTPEGVIAAAAVKCLGGAVQGRLWPRTDEERQSLLDDGFDLDKVLTTDDLVAGRRRLRRGDRRHRRRAPQRRSPLARRRGHGLDRHALALRHGAPHRGLPPPGEAHALLRQGVPLTSRHSYRQ